MRNLVEALVALDPLLADLLYILDNRGVVDKSSWIAEDVGVLPITTWQSYGRREIRTFERLADNAPQEAKIAIALPCARRRPYSRSRTHSRIWSNLSAAGWDKNRVDQVVITSLGIIPSSLWNHPVVVRYDAGVPDIYRTLRLARRFFGQHEYETVVDCLEFRPYSDVLQIVHREGLITNLKRGPVTYSRQFVVKV
ncbi:MAG: DUF5591 domain-containing protein [Bryobacteraceae bacterium]|nr:DUF5591 domain-containing protein [Bryobacteraceae bacterium]